jgi:hypothetical protein
VTDPHTETLSEAWQWLRVADPAWDDPLDPTFAQHRGGRWNPKASFPTLYLNEDLHTAKAQIHKMLGGSPVAPEDLDEGYVLIAATLPSRQIVADAVTSSGVQALGLPMTYPLDTSGQIVSQETCQPIGVGVKEKGLRGVHARSAATPDGAGRELAWYPARRSSRATAVGDPIPFSEWWHADTLAGRRTGSS